MSSIAQSNLPARLVLGRATFLDRTKADVTVLDILYKHPDIGLVADGMGVVLAEDFPLALTSDERHRLPGLSFGDAVVRALPREMLVAFMEKRGQALNKEEERELLQPLIRAATYGDVMIAGVPCPPVPDPQYVPFAPNMLHHWRFVPGQDVADPLFPGAAPFMSLRVFTLLEWAVLDATDRRLRARPRESATSGAPTSLNPTSAATSRIDKGGAPPKPGWPAFIAEVVRYADFDGIKSKRELNRHMKDWCTHNWRDAPDESTIRRKIAEFCPHAPS